MEVPGKLMYLLIVILFINFFISGLLVNFFQLILWVTVKPASPTLYRKINYYCLYSLWIRKFHLEKYSEGLQICNQLFFLLQNLYLSLIGGQAPLAQS